MVYLSEFFGSKSAFLLAVKSGRRVKTEGGDENGIHTVAGLGKDKALKWTAEANVEKGIIKDAK